MTLALSPGAVFVGPQAEESSKIPGTNRIGLTEDGPLQGA
jgi:hypothetical protein